MRPISLATGLHDSASGARRAHLKKKKEEEEGKKKKRKILPCKVHLMNVHAGRRETGVRLHRATLKKPNTSIASFLDSRLIFQSLFRAAYHVTVLQRPKPGQRSNTAGLMIKMKMGFLSFFFLFSLRRQAFVVLSYPCVCGASVCLIRINLAWGGLPSCVLRFMTLI